VTLDRYRYYVSLGGANGISPGNQPANGYPKPAMAVYELARLMAERGEFLLAYIEMLLHERTGESEGFRHVAPAGPQAPSPAAARGHDRWVVNKLRALNSWYTKGIENGSHLRTAINSAESLDRLREVIAVFFGTAVECGTGV